MVSETVSGLLKMLISRPRPVAVIENINLLCHRSFNFSFPSGHATLIFTAATIISLVYPKFKWLSFSIASLVAISRVYVGAHFPSDIIAGACLGAVIGAIIARIAGQLFN